MCYYLSHLLAIIFIDDKLYPRFITYLYVHYRRRLYFLSAISPFHLHNSLNKTSCPILIVDIHINLIRNLDP